MLSAKIPQENELEFSKKYTLFGIIDSNTSNTSTFHFGLQW